MGRIKYANEEYARDLAGQTFGHVTALRRAKVRSDLTEISRNWICKCACGKEVAVQASDLVRGRKKSCGCKRTARGVESAKHRHGMSYSAEYAAWISMGRRCTYEKNIRYQCYGGRGIMVCERWADFRNFIADMGPRPSPDHSLDRYPNKDGNYEPGNVRWATRVEQARNKRNNRLITIEGRTECATAWEKELGVPKGIIIRRVSSGTTLSELQDIAVKRRIRRR
jgi:hypothetical protein